MATTPKLGLPLLEENQDRADLTINDALRLMDASVQLSVKDRDLSDPPATPANGDSYLVKATGTGAWAGKDGKVAVWYTDALAWYFLTPAQGWTIYVVDEAKFLLHDGTALVAFCSAVDDIVDATGGTVSTTLSALTNLTALTNLLGGTAGSSLGAVTLPADSPANADALRDDLVANAIANIRDNLSTIAAQLENQRLFNAAIVNAIASLAARQNDLRAKLRSAGILAP